jgi:transposase InsO family protein
MNSRGILGYISLRINMNDKFKEFKALVENQIKKRIKVLRTDNGKEFNGNEFEELCKNCGLSSHKNTPYTPQQNGVADRLNITLMEKTGWEDPGFNTSTLHQQNPNYQPFWQHLRSR